jgi:hypothetical protein
MVDRCLDAWMHGWLIVRMVGWLLDFSFLLVLYCQIRIGDNLPFIVFGRIATTIHVDLFGDDVIATWKQVFGTNVIISQENHRVLASTVHRRRGGRVVKSVSLVEAFLIVS